MPPARFVQINRQEIAGFIQQHRIHSSYEVAASCVRAYEMLVDHIIRHGQELSMLTTCAFDARLFANAGHPLVRADRRVTRLPGRTTLEAARIDILSPSKERAKECNLLFGWRSVMDGPWMRCHCPFSIQNTQMTDNSLSLVRQSGVRRSSARCGQPRHAR